MNGDPAAAASLSALPVPAMAAPCNESKPATVWRYAGWVFVSALVIRLAWCTFATVTPISDCSGYDAIAHELLQTGRFYDAAGYAWRTPGYPAFLAGVYAVLADDVRAVALAQAFLGALGAAATVLLAAHVAAPRASLLAGLLLAIWPTAVVYTPVLVTENLVTPLLLFSLLCLAQVGRVSRRWALALVVGAGVFFGLLLLVRPSNCFFAPALLILLGYDLTQRKWRLLFPLVFGVVALLVLAPWLIRNYRLGFGPFTLSTQGALSMWWGNNPMTEDGGSVPPRFPKEEAGLDEGGLNHLYSGKVLTWVRENPRRYLVLSGVRAVRFLGKQGDWFAAYFAWPTPDNDVLIGQLHVANIGLQGVPKERVAYARALVERHVRYEFRLRRIVAPLMLLAFVWSFFRLRTCALINLPALFYLAGLSFTVFVERYRVPSDPLFLILLATLLSDIFFGTRDLGGGRIGRIAKAGLAILVVTASLYVHKARLDTNWYSAKRPPAAQTAPASRAAI